MKRNNHAKAKRPAGRQLGLAIGIGAGLGIYAGKMLGIAMLFAEEVEVASDDLSPPRSDFELYSYLALAIGSGAIIGAMIGLIAFFVWRIARRRAS